MEWSAVLADVWAAVKLVFFAGFGLLLLSALLSILDTYRAKRQASPRQASLFWYVDQNSGDDDADGLSSETAFATVERAYEMTSPGDHIVMLTRGKSS